jgi:pyruvate/2-oxoglutarate dehydrogenase complex dihydrolipoamide dehydrogenase (E3) component
MIYDLAIIGAGRVGFRLLQQQRSLGKGYPVRKRQDVGIAELWLPPSKALIAAAKTGSHLPDGALRNFSRRT